jgi:hypothetical protein
MLDNRLMAVKEIRITGDLTQRERFSMVALRLIIDRMSDSRISDSSGLHES